MSDNSISQTKIKKKSKDLTNIFPNSIDLNTSSLSRSTTTHFAHTFIELNCNNEKRKEKFSISLLDCTHCTLYETITRSYSRVVAQQQVYIVIQSNGRPRYLS